MTDEELMKHLRDLGDHAAFEPHTHHTAADRIGELIHEIKELNKQLNYWQSSAEHWRGMWSKAANRLLRVDPELSGPMTTTAEEIRKVQQVLKDQPQAEPQRGDPWKEM